MSVLQYIKKKYEETKIMNLIMKSNNCDHTFEICNCPCHTTPGIMHIRACCSQVKCPECHLKYNKKSF